MSQAALQLAQDRRSDPSENRDWSMLISIDEAAPLLGMSAGQLRRKCGDELLGRGMAINCKPPQGGNARWFVDRRYDLRLARGYAGAVHQTPDLGAYTQKQRTTAWRRVEAVKRLREARQSWSGRQKDWMPTLLSQIQSDLEIKVSRTSLLRWDQLYKAPADVVKLIDTRGGDQKSLGDPAAWDHLRGLYLSDRKPTLADCWRRTKIKAHAEGWTWCSYDGCRRQLDDRIPPETQLFHRDPRKWRWQMEPYIAQDTERFAAGECWVGDHCQLDLWCRVGSARNVSLVRPWITAWQDWRTRRIVGWTLSISPNSSTILQAFKRGMEDDANHGGPSSVWIDNGKDYDAWLFHGQTKQQRLAKRHLEAGYIDEPEFKGLFGILNPPIEVHFSLAYNPNGKARMERWFGTLHDQFDRAYVSYAGRSVEQKPESLKKVLEHPNQIPWFDDILGDLTEYIAAYNARAEHQIDDLIDAGQTISPDYAMAHWCERRLKLADPSSLNLFMQHWHKPVQMTRNGLRLTLSGQSLYYGAMDEALGAYKTLKGKDRPWLRVTYDPFDLSTVRVYNEQFEWVCDARMNDKGGGRVSQDDVKDLIKRKRDYRKALKTVESSRELEYLSAAEVLTLSSEQRDPEPPTPTDPHPMQIVRTPVDGQSEAVQQHRKAAGAEHDDMPAGAAGLPDLSDFMGDVTAPQNHSGASLPIDDFRYVASASSIDQDGDLDVDDDDDPYSAFKGGVL